MFTLNRRKAAFALAAALTFSNSPRVFSAESSTAVTTTETQVAVPPATMMPPPDAGSSAEQKNHLEKLTLDELFSGRTMQRISLPAAIEMALKNNLDVRYEKAGIQIQRAQEKFARGAFDPVFNVSTQYQEVKRPQDINNPSTTSEILQQQALQTQLNQAALTLNSAQTQAFQSQVILQQQQNALNQQYILSGQTPPAGFDQLTQQQVLPVQQISNPILNNIVVLNQQGSSFSASFSGRTALGTRYALQAASSLSRNTFSGDIQPLRTIYEDSVQIQIQQPLLKNFGPNANLADVRTARIAAKVQTLTWKNNISTSVQAVMAAYYDMVYAMNSMRVQEDATEADARLVNLYQRRVDLGFGSPFDIRQAEVQVSTDRESLLSSKNTFLERQFALKRLVLSSIDLDDSRLFVPGSTANLVPPLIDRSALLRLAFQNRYDYRGTLLNAEAQNIRLNFAKNQLLPQLDLVATYGLNGLGHSLGNGVSNTFTGDQPQWSVGLQFQMPIGNRQARAQYDASLAQREQAILRIKQAELAVGVDVDTAISRIETNRQRLEAARKTRELGDEAVRIAFRRLEEGQISAYDITEQQRRLFDAKTRELAAQAELNKAVTILWLVTGTVLEREGITFTEPTDTYTAMTPVSPAASQTPVPAQAKRR